VNRRLVCVGRQHDAIAHFRPNRMPFEQLQPPRADGREQQVALV
jgi:hypothetical protein